MLMHENTCVIPLIIVSIYIDGGSNFDPQQLSYSIWVQMMVGIISVGTAWVVTASGKWPHIVQ